MGELQGLSSVEARVGRKGITATYYVVVVIRSSNVNTTLVLMPSPSMANYYAKPSNRTRKQRSCLDSKGNRIAASRRSESGTHSQEYMFESYTYSRSEL